MSTPRATDTHPSHIAKLVFFVAARPTLPNIQGLTRLDKGRKQNIKRKATSTTGDSIGSWASPEGEYYVDLFKPELGDEVRVHDTSCGWE